MSLRQSGGSERGAGAEGESSCEGRRKASRGEGWDGACSAPTGAGWKRGHEAGSSLEHPSPQPVYPSQSCPWSILHPSPCTHPEDPLGVSFAPAHVPILKPPCSILHPSPCTHPKESLRASFAPAHVPVLKNPWEHPSPQPVYPSQSCPCSILCPSPCTHPEAPLQQGSPRFWGWPQEVGCRVQAWGLGRFGETRTVLH